MPCVFQATERPAVTTRNIEGRLPRIWYEQCGADGTPHALLALARKSRTPASGCAPTILATTLPFLKASCSIVSTCQYTAF